MQEDNKNPKKQYLVPVRYKENDDFAFMVIVKAYNLYDARVIANYIYHNDLKDHLYIDIAKDFKAYR